MNTGIDVPQIQRFGALYIAAARLKSISKWKAIIAAVDIGNPLFYLIAVGVGIGVLVEQGSGTSGTNGIKYIAFIAPALLANSAIAAVMDETIFPTIEGFKWRKLFFAQNATPITGRQIALGVYLSALCRAIFSVSIYYVLLLAFNVVDFGPSILLIPIAVLGGGAFGAIILFAAAKIEKDDQFFNILGRLVIMPMFLFSGAFYPLTVFPGWGQAIIKALPLRQGIELVTRAMAGEFSAHLLVNVTYFMVMICVGLFFTTKRLNALFMK